MYDRNRGLVWLVVALIILNIGSMGFLWYRESNKPPRPTASPRQLADPGEFIEKELNLTEAQSKAFTELRLKHQGDMRKIQDDIFQLSKDLVEELFKPSPDSNTIVSISEDIGRKQADFEKLMFFHFNKLKEICEPEQREKLRQMLFEIIGSIRSAPPGGRGEPPEGMPPRPGEDFPDRKGH